MLRTNARNRRTGPRSSSRGGMPHKLACLLSTHSYAYRYRYVHTYIYIYRPAHVFVNVKQDASLSGNFLMRMLEAWNPVACAIETYLCGLRFSFFTTPVSKHFWLYRGPIQTKFPERIVGGSGHPSGLSIFLKVRSLSRKDPAKNVNTTHEIRENNPRTAKNVKHTFLP